MSGDRAAAAAAAMSPSVKVSLPQASAVLARRFFARRLKNPAAVLCTDKLNAVGETGSFLVIASRIDTVVCSSPCRDAKTLCTLAARSRSLFKHPQATWSAIFACELRRRPSIGGTMGNVGSPDVPISPPRFAHCRQPSRLSSPGAQA
jgi:hypothetical protein